MMAPEEKGKAMVVGFTTLACTTVIETIIEVSGPGQHRLIRGDGTPAATVVAPVVATS
jgi:hypothetical protein